MQESVFICSMLTHTLFYYTEQCFYCRNHLQVNESRSQKWIKMINVLRLRQIRVLLHLSGLSENQLDILLIHTKHYQLYRNLASSNLNVSGMFSLLWNIWSSSWPCFFFFPFPRTVFAYVTILYWRNVRISDTSSFAIDMFVGILE